MSAGSRARGETERYRTLLERTAIFLHDPDRNVLGAGGRPLGGRARSGLRAAPRPGTELHLELSTMSFVSRDGVDLLARLRGGRARLLNCSPCSRFVAEQLEAAGGGRVEGTGEGRV